MVVFCCCAVRFLFVDMFIVTSHYIRGIETVHRITFCIECFCVYVVAVVDAICIRWYTIDSLTLLVDLASLRPPPFICFHSLLCPLYRSFIVALFFVMLSLAFFVFFFNIQLCSNYITVTSSLLCSLETERKQCSSPTSVWSYFAVSCICSCCVLLQYSELECGHWWSTDPSAKLFFVVELWRPVARTKINKNNV